MRRPTRSPPSPAAASRPRTSGLGDISGTPFPLLFSPFGIGSLSLRNRIVSAAALTGLAEPGLPSEAQIAYYVGKARGGAALVVFESTPVHPTGAGFARTVHPYDVNAKKGLHRLADAVHRHGAAVVAQLWHCGRQGSSAVTGLPLVAPSAIACPVAEELPVAMTLGQIDELVEAFATAALAFKDVDFDGVEVAGGHGYLVHQFLSPLANLRTDGYGGSPENRERFLLEILDAIRVSCGPDFALGVRLSADELLAGGFGLEDTARLVRRLATRRAVDLVSASAGTHASAEQMVGDWSIPHGNLVDMARSLRAAAGHVPVIACGRIVEPAHAEEILRCGDADLIGMARALIADPHWPDKARRGRVRSIRPCIACNGCESRLFSGLSIACAVNPVHAGQKTICRRHPGRSAWWSSAADRQAWRRRV